uniref:AAA+ ATPase domain-containing protein n=1 Tax=Chlamydomonas euryale TaxID=1486919 RepID=A0A7R9V8S0_9CHLO|mmetsp:Transcript_25617/g.75750  ORF Transcript_25617/g.75750 Transcript_25617/m.75750 type:complete len:422 (+) Transcript_25617:75-1340(+)
MSIQHATKTMTASPAGRRMPLWLELLQQAVAIGGLVWTMKVAMQYLDPYREQRQQAKKRAAFLQKALGKSVELNEFEQLLAANVMNPKTIDVAMDEVSGLDGIVQELELKVLFPLQKPELYCTTLWKQTRGVLFYGPPGTGKTMLAKALAKQSGCYFLNITASSIMSKWLGDASRLVRAVFTLAAKLQPCIIFIDEVDALLGKRGMHTEHEATLQVKTEFMQLWDGMESCRGQRVVVMGATNRPWMVDEAVLRRFSTQYEIGLPDAQQRRAILRSYLLRHRHEIGERGLSQALLLDAPDEGSGGVGAVTWIAQRTDGFSGSDLVELCSQAAQAVLAEFWQANREELRGARGAEPAESSGMVVRELRRADFEVALAVVLPSTHKANEYQLKSETGSGTPGGGSEMLAMMMQLLAAGKSGAPP